MFHLTSKLLFLILSSVWFGWWLHSREAGWFLFSILGFIDFFVTCTIDELNDRN